MLGKTFANDANSHRLRPPKQIMKTLDNPNLFITFAKYKAAYNTYDI